MPQSYTPWKLSDDAVLHRSVPHALIDAANHRPESTALVCDDRRYSYREYLSCSAGLAAMLSACDLRGGRIAMVMRNSAEFAIVMMGIMMARAQFVPVNPEYTAGELRKVVHEAQPSAVICDPDVVATVAPIADAIGIRMLICADDQMPFRTWMSTPSVGLPSDLPDQDDLAVLPFTGGTTGVPKGANLTHRAVTHFFRFAYSFWPVGFDDHRYLTAAPMYHGFGHQFATWLPIYTRSELVIVRKYAPRVVLELMQAHRITIFAGGPASVYLGLINNEAFDRTDLSSLRYCFAGGSACSEDLLRRWQAATGCRILQCYGMTEGSPIACTPVDVAHLPLTVGKTPPESEVQVVDIETGTKELPPNERGEIRARGPQFMRDYRNRPDETKAAMRNGWFYTGDIGYFDNDGNLFLVDRKKELIIVGGYNVFPREIDELFAAHPAVSEVATIGAPDTFLGEKVIVYVSPRPGAEISEQGLLQYCESNLVKYKRPARIIFLDTLPKTNVRKIDKIALRRLFAETSSGDEASESRR